MGRAEADYVISASHASSAIGEFQKVKCFLALGQMDGRLCERELADLLSIKPLSFLGRAEADYIISVSF